jgi:cytosine/adenosine deaminase-related metal-dependent hydrolase
VAATITDLDFASSLPLELVPGAAEQLKPKRVARVEDISSAIEGFIDRWQGRHPLVQPMVGPSSLPRCSTELFEAAVDIARRRGVGLQTHLLSAKSQVFVGHARYGGSTVEFLDRIGCLQPWASFAHSIWLDDAEVRRIAASDAVVVHNPVSNLKLGAGRSPVPDLLKHGAKVALGSDGASSADNQNMFETVKGAAVLHRIATDHDDWISADRALELCWVGGASALRTRSGRIAPGYEADLTILDRRSLFLAPKEQVQGQIVHSELGASVETVLVAGRAVMKDRVITLVNEAAIHVEAQATVERLYAGLPERMAKFEAVRPLMQTLERTVNRADLHFTRYCC